MNILSILRQVRHGKKGKIHVDLMQSKNIGISPYLQPYPMVGGINGSIMGWFLNPNPTRAWIGMEGYANSFPPQIIMSPLKPPILSNQDILRFC